MLKAEAVTRTCSVKKVLLEILQNAQESTCARVSFLQSKACIFTKRESLIQVSSCEFCKHLCKNIFFYKTTLVATSVKAYNFTKIRLHHRWFFLQSF